MWKERKVDKTDDNTVSSYAVFNIKKQVSKELYYLLFRDAVLLESQCLDALALSVADDAAFFSDFILRLIQCYMQVCLFAIRDPHLKRTHYQTHVTNESHEDLGYVKLPSF